MQKDSEPPQVLILDFDDTVIRRNPIVRIGGFLSRSLVDGKTSRDSRSEDEQITLEDVAKRRMGLVLPYDMNQRMNHEMVDGGFKGPLDRLSYFWHAGREAFPEAVSEIEAEFAKGTKVIVATGRSSREPWVRMTNYTLEREGLRGLVSHVYFTPEGVSTIESKADVVSLTMEENPDAKIRFRDDDPRTVGEIARRFLSVQAEYMFHPITAGLVRANFTTDNIRLVTRNMIAERYGVRN